MPGINIICGFSYEKNNFSFLLFLSVTYAGCCGVSISMAAFVASFANMGNNRKVALFQRLFKQLLNNKFAIFHGNLFLHQVFKVIYSAILNSIPFLFTFGNKLSV